MRGQYFTAFFIHTMSIFRKQELFETGISCQPEGRISIDNDGKYKKNLPKQSAMISHEIAMVLDQSADERAAEEQALQDPLADTVEKMSQ